MLSNTCKYALRSIIYIGIKSSSTSLVNVRTIATDLDVPMQFLSKILQVFVRKGILNSVKGPSGGFNFKRDPGDVTLYELVTIIDGQELFDNCIVGTKPCNSSDSKREKCPVHEEYSSVRNEVAEFFKSETVGKVIENYDRRANDFLSL